MPQKAPSTRHPCPACGHVRIVLRKKPWRAVVKSDGVQYFLGYFHTHEEADQREREFREEYGIPRNRHEAVLKAWETRRAVGT